MRDALAEMKLIVEVDAMLLNEKLRRSDQRAAALAGRVDELERLIYERAGIKTMTANRETPC
jgi:hypothetical protein